tara:strand:+ start:750 stop:1943 length:1194 start_codon:yes stop_codon:yes gene_type:complete
MFGIYYFFLFIYSIFALFGYLFLPGLSESIYAYFGDDVGYEAAYFCFASLAGFFFLNYALLRRRKVTRVVSVSISPSITPIGLATLGVLTVVFTIMLIINFEQLSWYLSDYVGAMGAGISIFLALYKISVGLLLVCYCIVRSNINSGRVFVVLSLLYFLAFAIASIRLGNRTDPAAFMLGVMVFELGRRKLSFRTFFWTGAAGIVAVIALSLIEHFRYAGGGGEREFVARIVQNDYYAPAHMLFAAIAYDFVRPIEVIKSNSANAFILLNYPYLHETVTDLFKLNVATRAQGYAFYIFTEGWMALGKLGFIYNWIIPTAGLMLWRNIARTNNPFVNNVIISLMACMTINLVRSQSSYFVKYIYTFIIPALLFLALLIAFRFARDTMSRSSLESRWKG